MTSSSATPRDATRKRGLPLLLLAGTLALAPAPRAEDVLVPFGASWSYKDDGVAPGGDWTTLAFDDAGWPAGPAELGYGDGDEATVVSYGPDAANKHLTTWFRHRFTLDDPSGYASATVHLQKDDGAIVYLNGTEVLRSNMKYGTVTPSTFASSVVPNNAEDRVWEYHVPPWLLQAGDNVLALELHQNVPHSPDLGFDLQLSAGETVDVVRGPYLQLGTSTSMVVRWRTLVPTTSRVRFGTAPGALDQVVEDPAAVTDHELELSGLSPATVYHYAVGSLEEDLAGGTPGHAFRTAPAPGTPVPTRVWVLGDSGTANLNAERVRDAWHDWSGGVPPDLWLMLGDNAYSNGLDEEHQAAVFDMYEPTLAASPLFPTRGNHEVSAATYYDLFTLPDAGQAGGVSSGTEAYYSFDWANVHFVCLDSHGSDRSIGGPMYTWLEADLAAHDQEWVVVFWHHPPYSKGSHDSDVDTELVQMRERFVPLLEDWGVDLVLGGHSHSYERSYLIDGHHGDAASFAPGHLVDGGDGRVDGDGPYLKSPGPHAGAVYCVAGSSGKMSNGPLDHPAMFYSVKRLGSVVLDVHGPVLDVTFLDDDALVDDHFRLEHPSAWVDLGASLPGSQGTPSLVGAGMPVPQEIVSLTLTGGVPGGTTYVVLGLTTVFAPFKGGVLVPSPDILVPQTLDASGSLPIAFPWPPLPPGVPLIWQHWMPDAGGVFGFSASNALSIQAP